MHLEGRRIRNIRVEHQLGRGGMGRVYLGFDEVLRRRVALKAIRASRKLDPDTKARFLREARLLSALEHPNICRIYDFIEDAGQEILVLEYVEGRTLAQLMAEGLDERTRFELLTQLAQALEAAHAAGVIHRDLKPDNVMWTPGGKVKVLDFGLARGLDDPVQVPPGWTANDGEAEVGTIPVEPPPPAPVEASRVTGSAVTELGSVIGTVAYMSPEQAQGAELTTASDMYSFGILCQELFTEAPAYSPEVSYVVRLKKVALAETEPIRGIDRELTGLVRRLLARVPDARPRATDARERLLRIRDRARRRLRWFLAALTALTLIAAAGKYTLDLRRAKARTEAALVVAEQSRTEAQRVTDFLVDVFQVSNPGEARGNAITAREVLDRGAERIETELADEPRIQARLLGAMGTVYHQLGLYREAADLLERSVQLARAVSGTRAGHQVADTADEPGKPRRSADARLLADCLLRLGDTYHFLDRYDEAERLVTESLELRVAALGADHAVAAEARALLGKIVYDRGDLPAARRHFEHAVESLWAETQRTGHVSATLGTSLTALADVEADEGELSRAEELFLRAFEVLRVEPGAEHPAYATAQEGLAQVYLNQGRPDDAEPLIRQSLALRQRVLGPSHASLGISWSFLGYAAQERGDARAAREHLEKGYQILRQNLEPNHFNIGANRLLVGNLDVELERWADAEDAYEQSLEVWRSSGLEAGYNAIAARDGLADVAFGRGRYEQAVERYERVAEEWREHLGTVTTEWLTARLGMARALRRLGRADEARAEADAVIAQAEALDSGQTTPESTGILASLHLLCGRLADDRSAPAEARRRYETALAHVQKIDGADSKPGWMALQAELLLRLGRHPQAEPLLGRLRELAWRDTELWRLAGDLR